MTVAVGVIVRIPVGLVALFLMVNLSKLRSPSTPAAMYAVPPGVPAHVRLYPAVAPKHDHTIRERAAVLFVMPRTNASPVDPPMPSNKEPVTPWVYAALSLLKTNLVTALFCVTTRSCLLGMVYSCSSATNSFVLLNESTLSTASARSMFCPASLLRLS